MSNTFSITIESPLDDVIDSVGKTVTIACDEAMPEPTNATIIRARQEDDCTIIEVEPVPN